MRLTAETSYTIYVGKSRSVQQRFVIKASVPYGASGRVPESAVAFPSGARFLSVVRMADRLSQVTLELATVQDDLLRMAASTAESGTTKSPAFST